MPERRTGDNECGLLPTPRLPLGGGQRSGDRKEEAATLDQMARKGLLPTPTAQDSGGSRNRTSSRPPDSKHHDGITLTDAVWMGMLPTPDANCWKDGSNPEHRRGQLTAARFTGPTGADGPMRLNPQFVAWMQGYPPDWLDVECPRSRPSATPSSRKSPTKSSGR
jgi:hypothetical protein